MGESLKIAFIYDVVYPWVKGGVEKRIYELARRLVMKHEVHIYGYKHWDGKETISRNGIIYHGTIKPKKIYSSGKRSVFPPFFHSIKLLPLLKRRHFDIIDCQAAPYFPCYAAKVNPSNLVVTWHEFWGNYWMEYLGKLGIFGRFIEEELFSLTDNHVSVSLKTKRDLLNGGLKEDVHIIPNGIDFKQIHSIKPSGSESDIVFVGRLIREKNVELLLKSAKILREEIPDIRIVIIGDGPERSKLELLSKKLGISQNVAFLGFLKTHEEVIAHVKSSKVFAFPSLREGFGIVVLEANASGLPVVTVSHAMNASVDLISEGKNGFVARVNENDFAEKILIALEKRRKIGKVAISIASKYDWDEIAKELEGYYGGVL